MFRKLLFRLRFPLPFMMLFVPAKNILRPVPPAVEGCRFRLPEMSSSPRKRILADKVEVSVAPGLIVQLPLICNVDVPLPLYDLTPPAAEALKTSDPKVFPVRETVYPAVPGTSNSKIPSSVPAAIDSLSISAALPLGVLCR